MFSFFLSYVLSFFIVTGIPAITLVTIAAFLAIFVHALPVSSRQTLSSLSNGTIPYPISLLIIMISLFFSNKSSTKESIFILSFKSLLHNKWKLYNIFLSILL